MTSGMENELSVIFSGLLETTLSLHLKSLPKISFMTVFYGSSLSSDQWALTFYARYESLMTDHIFTSFFEKSNFEHKCS